MKVVFLHIPKTAGQSVHHFLTTNFPKDSIFPARVNSQTLDYTVDEIKKYNIYSGHFNMSLLEIVDQPKFVFTILRKPIDRILSYYFYLRKEARKLSKTELNSPNRQGMKAIITLSPDEYFCDESLSIRSFIDDHYDNFYMYYFAMKSYHGRSYAQKLIELNLVDINNIYYKAVAVLKNDINKVYDVSEWNNLAKDLINYFPNKQFDLKNIVINKGDGKSTEDRIKQLINLGATQKTIDRLYNFCEYDDKIYQSFCPISEQKPLTDTLSNK